MLLITLTPYCHNNVLRASRPNSSLNVFFNVPSFIRNFSFCFNVYSKVKSKDCLLVIAHLFVHNINARTYTYLHMYLFVSETKIQNVEGELNVCCFTISKGNNSVVHKSSCYQQFCNLICSNKFKREITPTGTFF